MLGEKELALLGDKYMIKFKELNEMIQAKKEIESKEKAIKAELEEIFTSYGIEKFSNEYITMTYIKPTESKSVDLKALQDKEPALYGELLQDYPKVTKRKGYMKFS